MKSHALPWIAALLFAGVSVLPAREGPPQASPSLVYAGWFGDTTPTPSYISANLAFLESQPFDGLVVYLRDPGMTSNVTMMVMSSTPVSHGTALWVMSPMIGLPFVRLTDNLGMILASTPPDFFDDWSVPIQNFANVARAAKDAGLKGLCFDNEQYFAPWGNYPAGVLHPEKSLAEYQAQARLRGRQVMEAMVAQFPEIVVLTLHGPYISELQAPPPFFPQLQAWNELMGPFFAGFMQGKGSLAQNVDGGELYDLRSADEFSMAYDWRKTGIASEAVNCPFIPAADRPSWPSQTSIGFGVYDMPSGGAAMNPSIAKTTLVNALDRTDRWVWFYVEGPTFLKPESQGGASQAWVDAVREAHDEAAAGGGSGGAPPGTGGGGSPASSSDSSSRCGLLGGEAALLILALGWLRGRFRVSCDGGGRTE